VSNSIGKKNLQEKQKKDRREKQRKRSRKNYLEEEQVKDTKENSSCTAKDVKQNMTLKSVNAQNAGMSLLPKRYKTIVFMAFLTSLIRKEWKN
jgi:hypothetical protein